MSATTTWKIDQMERQTADGLVTVVHWSAFAFEQGEAADKTYSANTYGALQVERGEDFTAFESLTEQQVIGWVQSAVGKDTVETVLAAQIEAQKSPVKLNELPWQQG